MSRKSGLKQYMSRLDEAKKILVQRDSKTTDIGEMERLEKERRVCVLSIYLRNEAELCETQALSLATWLLSKRSGIQNILMAL